MLEIFIVDLWVTMVEYMKGRAREMLLSKDIKVEKEIETMRDMWRKYWRK